MILKGEGFTYWLNGEQLKDFDEFEKVLKNRIVTIEVDKLQVKATEDGAK